MNEVKNTYRKYCPNVFVAKCPEQHEKGDVIDVETRHGKVNECHVHNLVAKDKEGFYYYSITRVDGFDYQAYCLKRAEKKQATAERRASKANELAEAAKEGADFLSLGEPIKVGHHSEKRHRALIERNWNRTSKRFELEDEAANYESASEYWRSKAKDINLSMPESLDYYEHKLAEATDYHAKVKSGEIERRHSYSLAYANKDKKKFAELHKDAVRLWGDND